MTLEGLEIEIEIMLKSLKVQFRKLALSKGLSTQFVCDDFGLVVATALIEDRSYVQGYLENKLSDYRLFLITNLSNMGEERQKIVWSLMEGGYMRYVRNNFPRQFTDLITMQNYGNKIIDERLRRWDDKPAYRFFVDENTKAKTVPTTMILAIEPGFFDYMPPEKT